MFVNSKGDVDMLNSLFGGGNTHIANMNVHFNMNGVSPSLQGNMPVNGQQIPYNKGNQFLLGNNSKNMLYTFDKIYIDSEYKLQIDPSYDTDKRPKGEFDKLNDRYTVTEFQGQNGYKHIPNIVGEIINRKEKNPPIVILLDWEDVEDKAIIDQILFNTFLLAKKYKHDIFFMVLETSGSVEPGEPYLTSFSKLKGLFKKEVYLIHI